VEDIESLKKEIGAQFEHQSEIIESQLQDLNMEITIAFHQCNNIQLEKKVEVATKEAQISNFCPCVVILGFS